MNGAHWPHLAHAAPSGPGGAPLPAAERAAAGPLSPAAPRRPLRLPYAAEPASLDPARCADSASTDFVDSLFAGLVRAVGANLTIEPDLATHWQVSPDGRRYRFFLRASGWSDGTPLTAHDFVFSVRRTLEPAVGAVNAALLFDLENAERYARGQARATDVGVQAIDAHTLEFTLVAPAPWFLQLTAHTVFKPVPTHLLAGGGAWPKPKALVTSGPFAVADWRFRRDALLRPNPHHWRAQALNLTAVHYLFVPRPEVGMALYEDGELDVSPSPVPLAFLAQAQQQAGRALRPSDRLASDFYWLNIARPPLDDVRVRQALSLAINREQLATTVLRRAAPASSLVPPAIGGTPYAASDFDPHRARTLLRAAGLGEGGRAMRPLAIVFNAHDEHRRVAEAIQAMWQTELGIEVTLSQREWQVYLSDVSKRDFDIARLGWVADYADPRSFLRDVLGPDSPHNQVGWRDAAFARWLGESDREPNPSRRQALLKRAEARTLAELPLLPLVVGQSTELVHTGVEGYERSAQGSVWLDRVWLSPEADAARPGVRGPTGAAP